MSLIEAGANVNIQNNIEFTPLMEAAFQRNNRIMRRLIDNDTGLETQTNKVDPTFMVAINTSNTSAAPILLNAESGIEVKNNRGYTPLMSVIEDGININLINLLIENAAAIESRDEKGNTVIMIHRYRNKIPAVKLLIQHDAEINAKTMKE